MKLKKPAIHRVFNGKRLRLTVVTGYGSEVFKRGATKREATWNIKRLRREGYVARMVKHKDFGYLIYSNKPWHKIPW